ncbi:hypothetical protein [Planifilum fimeticola]
MLKTIPLFLLGGLLNGSFLYRGMNMRTVFAWTLIICLLLSTGCSLLTPEKSVVDKILEEMENMSEPSEEEKQKVKQEAEQYLKERYGEEFYVDDLHYAWQTDRWSMRVHDKNGWDFWVFKDDGQFEDTYFSNRLSRDAQKEFKPIIEKTFDSLINWETSVIAEDEVEDQYAKSLPSYQELRKETQKYRQIIKIALATSLTEKKQEQEIEEVYRLVSYLNQNNIRAELDVLYYDPAIKKSGVKEVDFTRRTEYTEYSTGLIEIADVSEIKTKKDIEKNLIK